MPVKHLQEHDKRTGMSHNSRTLSMKKELYMTLPSWAPVRNSVRLRHA